MPKKSLSDTLDARRQQRNGKPVEAEFKAEDPVPDATPATETLQLRGQPDLTKTQQDVDAHFGDGLPYDLGRIKSQIEVNNQEAVEAGARAGAYLIWVREREGYGAFVLWLEQELDFGKSYAYQLMKVAERLSEINASGMLNAKKVYLRLSRGEISRAVAAADISPEELEEAAQTETLRGKTLDEYDQMGVRSLRLKVRDKDERITALQTQRGELEAQIQEQKKIIQKLRGAVVPDDKPANIVQFDHLYIEASRTLGELVKFMIELETDEREAVGKYTGTQGMATALQNLTTDLSELLTPLDEFHPLRVTRTRE